MKSMSSSFMAWCVVLGALAAGCSAPSMLVRPPESAAVNQAITAMWAREIRRTAETGDWLLTRSYSLTGDVITLASGQEVSHASMYDAARGTVIEAITPVVREVPLESLLARNRHVIIVRPSRLSAAERHAAIDRARETVGTAFDLPGLIGFSSESKFYCSELVYWASGMDRHVARPALLTPANLMEHGELVYFSGSRDDRQLQDAALASQARLHARAARPAELSDTRTIGR